MLDSNGLSTSGTIERPKRLKVEQWSGWTLPERPTTFVFMPTGQEDVYRFWLVQPNGQSSGTTRVDVCANPEDVQLRCEAGQMEIIWYREPKRIEDGSAYLICDIKETFPPQRRKQLILHLVNFRLEDIQKNSDNSWAIPLIGKKR